MKYCLGIFLFLFSLKLFALTPAQIFKTYSSAVVKINIYRDNVLVTKGSGFFFGDTGTILTNRHVFAPSLKKGARAEVVMKDGMTFKKILISNCGDDRNIDICLIKVLFKPRNYISVYDIKPDIGTEAFVIGHPREFDWSISKGIMSGIRSFTSLNKLAKKSETKKGVSQIQVDAPISPGNSGGPILNSNGELLGMATWIRKDQGSQNLNFGISASELQAYIKLNPDFHVKEKAVKKLKSEKTEVLGLMQKEMFDPAYTTFSMMERKKKVDPSKLDKAFFKRHVFPGFKDNYEIYLPSFFPKCKQTKSAKLINYICQDKSLKRAFLSFTIFSMRANILKSIGESVDLKTPLPRAKRMIKTGKWEAYRKTLTPKQRKHLFSFRPTPVKCKKPNRKSLYDVFGNANTCSYTTFNHRELDALTFERWIEFTDSNETININTWSPAYGLESLFAHTLSIGILSLNRVKK